MKTRPSRYGFTLMELMTVIAIIAMLILILVQATGDFRARADFSRCLSNVRSLYVAASNYVIEEEHWPQIDPQKNNNGNTQYAKEWYAALKKFGISWEGWVCPTVQRDLHGPDLTKPGNERVDYIATPFDSRPRTPYLWSTQPWFIEKSSSHPGGNLIIYSDGQSMPMKEALRRTYTGQ